QHLVLRQRREEVHSRGTRRLLARGLEPPPVIEPDETDIDPISHHAAQFVSTMAKSSDGTSALPSSRSVQSSVVSAAVPETVILDSTMRLSLMRTLMDRSSK